MSDNMSITTVRLRELIDRSGRSRTEIADSDELQHCDPSTITKHYNGDREVNADFITRYARFFHVSTDYLLGLTDQKTNNKDLKYACNYAGLSEEAINRLHEYNDYCRQEDGDSTSMDILNFFITSGSLCDLISIMYDYNNEVYAATDSIVHFTKLFKKEYKDYQAGRISADELTVYNPMDVANEPYVHLFKMQELPKDFIKAYFYEEHTEYRQALKKLFEENEKHQNIKYRKGGGDNGSNQETQ